LFIIKKDSLLRFNNPYIKRKLFKGVMHIPISCDTMATTRNILNEPMFLDVITGLGGIKAVEVVRTLMEHDSLSETELAEKIGIKEQAVRGILYKLYEKNVVQFRKERQENGWYVYHWTLLKDRLKDIVEERRRNTLELLRKKLEYETSNEFFRCENGCTRITFDKAFENDFLCQYCGAVVHQFDNSFIIEELSSYISRLESVAYSF